MEGIVALRQWRDSDLGPLSEMNADPEVMRFFLSPLSGDESRVLLGREREAIDRQGWGLWAVEVNGAFAGFTGLSAPSFAAHFTPCVEIGWRLRREFWGRGVAHAAARRAEAVAFRELGLAELVSFTAAVNLRSIRLMERLGFARDPAEDFLHPRVPANHPLRPHVLYRKRRPGSSPPRLPDSLGPSPISR
jgi:RimJ/RimL family protein N-acetyltransferase